MERLGKIVHGDGECGEEAMNGPAPTLLRGEFMDDIYMVLIRPEVAA